MFLDIFASVVMDFNESVAGFLFEALFAGIFEGYQIPAKEAETPADVSLSIRKLKGKKTDKFYSFKLLTKKGKISAVTGKAGAGTGIEGSATDLLRGFLKGEKELTYLIGLKSGGGGEAMTIDFYEFDITQETWFDWVGPPRFRKEEVLEKVEFVYGENEPEIVRNKLNRRVAPLEGKLVDGEFISRPKTKHKGQEEYQELRGQEVRRDRPLGSLVTTYGLVDKDGQPAKYLQTGEKYSVNIITGEKQALSHGSTNFMELYGPYVDNKIKFEHPENKSFIEYVLSGEYKTDTRFFEHLKKLPKFMKGGQFHLSQSRLMAGAAGTRGPASVTLDRKKFLKAADDYTEKVGKQIYDLFTNLANLVDHVSGYYLGVSAAERNSFAESAKNESKAVAESAQKHLVKVESDVMRGVVLDPAPPSKSPSKQDAKGGGTAGYQSQLKARESKMSDLEDFSREILENIKKDS